MQKKNILFVCLGNICRSPMAEGIMKKMVDDAGLGDLIYIDSAGIISAHQGEGPDRRMMQAGFQRGYKLEHRSRPIQSDDFEKFNLIIGMDDSNLSALHQKAPSAEAVSKIRRMTDYCKVSTLDHVPDPYYGGAEGFNLVIDLLEDACEGLLKEIRDER